MNKNDKRQIAAPVWMNMPDGTVPGTVTRTHVDQHGDLIIETAEDGRYRFRHHPDGPHRIVKKDGTEIRGFCRRMPDSDPAQPVERAEVSTPVKPVPIDADDFIFRQDGGPGGFWEIRFDGTDLPHVPASKGMVQIHRLLSKRMDPVPARDLHYISEHVHPDAIKDNSGALADTHGTEWSREPVFSNPGAARKAMQGRLDDIEAEMAEPSTPLETRDELQVEQAKLTKAIREISATIQTGGPQLARDDKRTAVKGTIDRAIAMIGKTTRCDELARHLTNMIETGTTCIYKGDHVWLTE